MNHTYTNECPDRTRNGSADSGRGASRFGSQAPRRSGGPARSGGYGRRSDAVQGVFAKSRLGVGAPSIPKPAVPSFRSQNSGSRLTPLSVGFYSR